VQKNVMPKHVGVIGGTKTNISGPATICWKSFLAMPQTISVEAPCMNINFLHIFSATCCPVPSFFFSFL